jgi:PAS domain S-box-containing protein
MERPLQENAEDSASRIKSLEKSYDLFMQAPVTIGVVKGRDYIIELANDSLLEVWGRTSEVIGKSLFVAIPELNDQGFRALLDQVCDTGEPFYGYEYPIRLNRDGTEEVRYFDFFYKPYYEDGQPNPVGVFAVGHDVTERILARKQLDEAQAETERQKRLYEAITGSTPDLIYVFDLNYRVAYANNALLSMWGKTWDEAINKRLIENGYEPWHAEMHEREIDQVVASRQPVRGEVSFPHAVLGKRIYDYILVPVINADGEVEAIAGTTRDITDIKRAQESLRSSEQRQTFLLQLNDVLRPLADPIEIQYEAASLVSKHFHADHAGFAEEVGDGNIFAITVDYSSSGDSLKGKYNYGQFSEKEIAALREGKTIMRGESINDASLSSDMKEVHASLQLAATVDVPLLKNGVLDAIFFLHYRDVHQWTDEELSLLKEVADRIWDAVGRAKAEQALRESEKRFRIMADAVPISIWITDKDGRIEFLNKHWWDYCGEPYQETTPADIAIKHLHPDDGPGVMQAFSKALETGQALEVEQRNRSWQGEYRWFLNRAIPYKDPASGQIVKWFGVGTDIHDRKLAEQALRQSEEALEKKVRQRTVELERINKELRRSNQNLEEFAHAASHDLKEPIRKIHFFTHQLKGQLSPHLKEVEIRSFNRIERATDRMRNLIDDLLLYSHVSHRPHETEAVDLNKKLQNVMEELELDIEEKKAVIRVGQLPIVKGYSRQLQQLFQNLISNAIKYSKATVQPVIEITASEAIEPEGTYHSISVKDNGIGFDQTYSDQIFQMFSRLHGKNEYSGTGVGLSIVKKVVENHNGFIKVESKPGQGSTFTVFLPSE